MHPVIHEYINALWIAFLAVWLGSAFSIKRAARRQSWSSRLVQGSLVAIGYFFIFDRAARLSALGKAFVPDATLVAWAGLVMVAAGIAIAIWARAMIGRNWSATVTVKQDHQLVRRGPYRIVRHPIYSGLLLAALGTAIAGREFRGLVGVGFVFAGFWAKLRLEERFMTEQFGAEYTRYKQEVRALIPFAL